MTTTTAAPTTTAYAIDRAHSEVAFQVRHLLSRVRGRFSEFDGALTYDEQHPDRSTVEVTIQAASIDTNEPQRDAHLRSADFFDVEQHPTLSFRGTRVTGSIADGLQLEGDLTIRGVTHPVRLDVTFLGKARDPWGAERLAFEAEGTINRKDFGLNWNAVLETGGFLVGDEVRILLAVQAVPKTE